MVHAYLTGQPAEPAILACRLVVDAGLGGGLALGPTLLIEAVQTLMWRSVTIRNLRAGKGFG
jgi:hypothetical protein